MKRLFLLLTAGLLALTASATDITYKADDVTVFPNPERGVRRRFCSDGFQESRGETRGRVVLGQGGRELSGSEEPVPRHVDVLPQELQDQRPVG